MAISHASIDAVRKKPLIWQKVDLEETGPPARAITGYRTNQKDLKTSVWMTSMMRLRGSAVSEPEVQISRDAILVAEASPHAKKPKSRDGEEAGADDGCRQRSSVEDQDLSRTQVV